MLWELALPKPYYSAMWIFQLTLVRCYSYNYDQSDEM